MDIQDRILVENPFPNYIVFRKGMQTMIPHPQFTAWGRIKSDTRFLEVPSILIAQMERLETSICEYQNILENKKIDLYHEAMEMGNEKQLDKQIRKLVNEQIYEKCNSNLDIIKTREYYEKWLSIQKETNEMLGILIKQVLLVYEG